MYANARARASTHTHTNKTERLHSYKLMKNISKNQISSRTINFYKIFRDINPGIKNNHTPIKTVFPIKDRN